jgi:hypothetical protein
MADSSNNSRDGGTVILVIGVQGAGKSWACRRAADVLHYIPHDRCWRHPTAKPKKGLDPAWGPPGSVSTHFETLVLAARRAKGPILTEAPFDETRLRARLEAQGVRVVPVFVIEDTELISGRYMAREGKKPAPGVLKRAEGLKNKAKEWNGFSGTSEEVLNELKRLAKSLS